MGQRLLPDAESLLRLHDEAMERWHTVEADVSQADEQNVTKLTEGSVIELILKQHRANFDLWHKEDEARDPNAADAEIAEVKRAIDALNQRRNDLTESIDHLLCTSLAQPAQATLHSETPGMMLDRLSILGLKVYHTREETTRETATEKHREKNRARLALLTEQRDDLAMCLDMLMLQIGRGERRFKVYRQMKMYNDPDLNPVLYRKGHS
ncbi:DUF4254 domain-containing protein [Granulicella sibirica]|uniref:DUF4254 domain-containing protein n=1 Tax=Granulicella sibirica TaxID=2479048 RepID=A0A4Q0T3Z9_9BACT|nr:DUF4254 domain-containing protein [Granulicella sibirica]RXH56758.1 hypothetical protein GRAN_0068 [Granulicella sibirica]